MKDTTIQEQELKDYHELTLRLTARIRELKAEVEQLKAELKKVEFWQKHYEELTLLRKVADAANDGNTFALVQALAELDEAKEGQE